MDNPPALPALPQGYEFHHIGYACADIERERLQFAALGYQVEGQRFSDTTQGIAGYFLSGAGPRLELLENLPGSDTLTPWLNAGIRMYHFAYWVDDIDAALAWARGARGKVMVQPVPASAFGGRRIAFVMFRNGMMLEFIERECQQP
ncbi:VOC family protein [Duganella qianjiadongensis]|uniref:VOC family protein n=1 Tax=Duganella qianjiadongensis TaxID=2692176 RepID=A0ABW9VNS1_9BURK|nr:VOC family protein [Duganella qianjiadongensis]MYM41218.1 VOC family protein [Duganella qianjiadongensis]